ncbi:MAG: hypothetical protein ASARMPREDX12_006296 [Alectoria sarmentosa]|nr:MAG: hypothetical protein ASARMPREDX12_006296 [Alectoria sarmentosa]
MATMDDMGNVAYYDIIPFYGNPDKGSIARWPKQLLDDVKYVYLGKEISLSMALALLSRMTDIPDRNYLKEAMRRMLIAIAATDLIEERLVESGRKFTWDAIDMQRKESTLQHYQRIFEYKNPLCMPREKLMLLLNVTVAHAAPMVVWKVEFPEAQWP